MKHCGLKDFQKINVGKVKLPKSKSAEVITPNAMPTLMTISNITAAGIIKGR
jgi:hypothetical protein